MKKRSRKILIYIISSFILVSGTVFIYKKINCNNFINKGIEFLENSNYHRALGIFDLVLENNPNNKKALENKEMVEKFLNAKVLLVKGDFKKAEELINEIENKSFEFKEFKSDVISLKGRIIQGRDRSIELENDINEIENLIEYNSFEDARELIKIVKKDELSLEQKSKVEDLNIIVQSAINNINEKKIKKEELNMFNKEDSKEKILKELDGISLTLSDNEELYSGSNIELEEKATHKLKEWNTELDKIYNLLKLQLSKEEFKTLENEEKEWEKYVESRAETEASEVKGLDKKRLYYKASKARMTRARCYELVKYHMK